MFGLKTLRFFPSIRRFIHMEHCKQKKMPDPWDLITGTERWQAIQYSKGNEDPFFIHPIKRGPGTKDCPNVIYSVYDKRVIGCICEPNSTGVVYMYLHEGFPKRCYCNYWFVLERIQPPPLYDN